MDRVKHGPNIISLFFALSANQCIERKILNKISFLTWDNILQFPYLKFKIKNKNKNDKTGGQKQCTETNMSKANSSKSIVYIEYS